MGRFPGAPPVCMARARRTVAGHLLPHQRPRLEGAAREGHLVLVLTSRQAHEGASEEIASDQVKEEDKMSS